MTTSTQKPTIPTHEISQPSTDSTSRTPNMTPHPLGPLDEAQNGPTLTPVRMAAV